MGVEVENFAEPLQEMPPREPPGDAPVDTVTDVPTAAPVDAPVDAVEAPTSIVTPMEPQASPPKLRIEKRESRLPVPGSRLPRKASNPTLEATTAKAGRLSLVTPKNVSGSLRKPSPNASPIRSPGLSPASPALKSQSSTGSLRSPATPTRLALPRSPMGTSPQQRSVSMSGPALPRLQRPASHSNLTAKKALPTLAKTPLSTTRSVSVSGPPRVASLPTPQPKRPSVTPKLPSSRKPSAAETKSTPAARTPLRARSFQAPQQSSSSSPKPLTPRLATVFPAPKPAAVTPKLAPAGSIKIPKRAPRPSIAPKEESPEPVDKRARALASSQALREQIKAARAARRESNAANIVGAPSSSNTNSNNNNWPEIIIVDEKKEEPEPEPEEEESDYEHPFGDDLKPQKPQPPPVRPGGILDLTAQTMQEFNENSLDETDTLMVKVLLLQKNMLTIFPPVVKGFRGLYTLDLSCNAIKGEYLTQEMEFPYLKTLLLGSNYIEDLDILVKNVDAPRLNYLDVHANRLKSYPKDLSKRYGALTTFVASDNKIEEIEVEALEGVQVVDLMNNCIGRLPPELGLLEGKGLRELRVMGNLFRVPRRQILERGTEAVCEWLRERIPVKMEEINNDDGDDVINGEKKEGEEGWEVVRRDQEEY